MLKHIKMHDLRTPLLLAGTNLRWRVRKWVLLDKQFCFEWVRTMFRRYSPLLNLHFVVNLYVLPARLLHVFLDHRRCRSFWLQANLSCLDLSKWENMGMLVVFLSPLYRVYLQLKYGPWSLHEVQCGVLSVANRRKVLRRRMSIGSIPSRNVLRKPSRVI